MSGARGAAPHFTTEAATEALAPDVTQVPLILATPDSQPHVLRARLTRVATATSSQAARRDDLAERVRLAILATVPVLHLGPHHLAERVGASIEDVRATLLDLTAAGWIGGDSWRTGRLDVLGPATIAMYGRAGGSR